MAKVPEECNAPSSIPRLATHISQRASGRRLYRSEQARTPAHEAWGRWAFVRRRADRRHRFASRGALLADSVRMLPASCSIYAVKMWQRRLGGVVTDRSNGHEFTPLRTGHHDTAAALQPIRRRRRAMAAADALVASATQVLDSCSDKTAILPKVVERLYKEFGKDECKAVMQGGAKRWFEQYPLNFRVDAHDAGGHAPWHTVTLIGSEWQTVAATSTAVASSEAGSHNIATAGPTPEVLCFTYGLHLLFSNPRRGWPSTKEELRIEAAPLCTGMGQKLYQLSSLGGVKVLSGTNLVWSVEKMRLLVLNTPPSIRQEAEILVRCAKMSASTRSGVSSDEAIEHGSVETSNGPHDGAALAMDCASRHVEATPAALPEPDAQPSSHERPSSTDPTTRLLEAIFSNVDAEHPDREADIVTRGIALGMLRARTGIIRLETRAEAAEARAELAEARVTTLEAELRKTGQMLVNALEAQTHLEGRLLQVAISSAVAPGEPRSAAEAQVVELEGLQ